MRRPLVIMLVFLAALPQALRAQRPAGPSDRRPPARQGERMEALQARQPAATLVDRIVALVDEDPIFESDVRRTIELGLAERREGESEGQLERRVLDRLIDHRLQLHEVSRWHFGTISSDAVERQLEAIRSRYESPEAYRQQLASLGLGEQDLRLLLLRQMRVLAYVEERLGPRIFVHAEAIEAYYRDVLLPELEARGAAIPALPAVREDIRALLREIELNREIELWTTELRGRADVVDLLDRRQRQLPPVVETIE